MLHLDIGYYRYSYLSSLYINKMLFPKQCRPQDCLRDLIDQEVGSINDFVKALSPVLKQSGFRIVPTNPVLATASQQPQDRYGRGSPLSMKNQILEKLGELESDTSFTDEQHKKIRAMFRSIIEQ